MERVREGRWGERAAGREATGAGRRIQCERHGGLGEQRGERREGYEEGKAVEERRGEEKEEGAHRVWMQRLPGAEGSRGSAPQGAEGVEVQLRLSGGSEGQRPLGKFKALYNKGYPREL